MRVFNLTKEQALFIKDLRINKGYSWRAVARDFSEQYPELGVDGNKIENRGNQIDGRDLCYDAMEFLSETESDGWN